LSRKLLLAKKLPMARKRPLEHEASPGEEASVGDARKLDLPRHTETLRDLRIYKPLVYTRVCFEIVNPKPQTLSPKP
jgi:hypothetical protein